MQSMIKLLGISTCCLVAGVAAANAEPVTLADADLDAITAGESGLGQMFVLGRLKVVRPDVSRRVV